MKPLLLALGATLLLAAPADASLKTDVDRLVDSGVPGAIVLARDGARTTRLAAGYADIEARTPMRPTDRFRAGSVTKANERAGASIGRARWAARMAAR